MNEAKYYPLYSGHSPVDQFTYRLSFGSEVKSVTAIGVNGSNEKIETYFDNGYWHMSTPTFETNPDYVKFEIN